MWHGVCLLAFGRAAAKAAALQHTSRLSGRANACPARKNALPSDRHCGVAQLVQQLAAVLTIEAAAEGWAARGVHHLHRGDHATCTAYHLCSVPPVANLLRCSASCSCPTATLHACSPVCRCEHDIWCCTQKSMSKRGGDWELTQGGSNRQSICFSKSPLSLQPSGPAQHGSAQ